MSYKDVRDLSEHLKLLGYPSNIPISVLNTSYGGPESFKAYSDILLWLIGRLEPGIIIPGGAQSENERVLLIRSATEFLVTKSSIKVNPRKLYASSSLAAGELLKITSLLMTAPQTNGQEEEVQKNHVEIDLSDKIDDLKKVRELSSELTNRGAALYDLLAKELVNKETRTIQSNRSLELATVERVLKGSISSLESKLSASKSQLETIKMENNNLSSKLQRKSSELERSTQRLQALQKVRPAYLEEFERLEIELRGLYVQYITRIRCVDALKFQLALKNRTPTPTSPLAKIPDSMTILPEGLMDSDDEQEEADDFDQREDVKLKEDKRILRSELLNRDRNSTRFRVRTDSDAESSLSTRGRGRVIGSMSGRALNDELDNLDSSIGSDESESDLELDDNGLIDEFRSEDDDESMAKLTRENSNLNRNIKQDHSDEDF